MKLLCLSEDQALSHQIVEEANHQQWKAIVVRNRDEVANQMNEHNPDMLLIDVGSIEDLDWWQEKGLTDLKPVLFLNKELTAEFVVRAFECGADGLVPKSLFSRRFLAARVKAYLRRQGIADSRRYVQRLSLVLDSQRYKVEVKGTSVNLTLTEFKILRELATEKEKVVARQEIQSQVFGIQQVSKRSLDVHICSLRKKLSPYSLDIDSVRGVGYRLSPCG
jgi:DNA-binding response OmpR family regulator